MKRCNTVTAAVMLSALGCGIGVSHPAAASVTRLEITSKQSYGTFKPGEFMLLEGRVVGELKPTEAIPDLDKAPRNAHGLVDYAARISLIIPANPASGNGALLRSGAVQ